MKTVRVTLTIDSDLLNEVRNLASEKGMSVGNLISRQLRQAVRDRKGYAQARRRALARLQCGFDLQWRHPASRDELHER